MKATKGTLWTFGSSFTINDHLYPRSDNKLSQWAIDNFQDYYDKYHDLNGPGKDVKGGWPTRAANYLEMDLKNLGEGGTSYMEVEDSILRSIPLMEEGDVVIIEIPFNERRLLFSPINGKRIVGAGHTLGDTIKGMVNDEHAQSYIDYTFHWYNKISNNSWDIWHRNRCINWIKTLDKLGVKAIYWDLKDHNREHQSITEHTLGQIVDLHWSTSGNDSFWHKYIRVQLAKIGVINKSKIVL